MNVWERLGNTQAYLKQTGKIANPFNSDGNVNFGVALDVAKNLPENAGSFNNNIEKARQKILQDEAITSLGTPKGILYGGLTGAMIPGIGAGLGVGVGTGAYGLAELDKKTDGKVSKALMAGTMGVRSNYAFVRDVAKHDAGLGFLSGLTVVAGGLVGALGGFLAVGAATGGVGAIPGAVAGFSVGAGLAGRAERKTAAGGVYDSISKDLKNSAKYSETVAGQEQYNFGRDAYRNTIGVAAKITGHEEIGDPTKGFGAVMSGVFNVLFEVSTAPDIKALKLAGLATKGAVLGGITTQSTTFLEGKLNKWTGETERLADRVAADVDLLKRTAAGEETVYTPVFKFIRENDAAALSERGGFKGDGYGQLAATLLAGQSDETISLVMRIARGDKEAATELATKKPAMHAEILRYESAIEMVESSGTQRVAYGFNLGGRMTPVSKNTVEVVEAELKDLRGQYSWLNRSLDLDSALQETTVSKFKGIEDFKNKLATGRVERKLEAENKYGLANETIFQRNGLSVLIRKVNRTAARTFDDAPHSTVNFNDTLQSNSRVRTSSRMAVNKGLILPGEARNLYNEFLAAKNEGQKDLFVDKFTETIFERVAAKHGVPSSMRDAVLANWNKIRRDTKAKAQESKAQGKAYMIDEVGDVVEDPQLISQLANGAYLPDVELIDKAFAAYAKRKGPEAGLPINVAVLGKSSLDEFNSLWRTFTLARVGFPINIMRDSTLRTWGDAVLFDSLRNLGEDAWSTMMKSTNTVKEIRDWTASVTNPKKNMKNIRQQIAIRDGALRDAEKALKKFDYDPKNPPKEISYELQNLLDYKAEVEKMAAELRRQEVSLLTKKDTKVVAADKMPISGYQFNAPFSGRLGEISFQKLRGKDDIRGLVASTRELEMKYIRSDRDGGRAIIATEDETKHLLSWESILNNQVRSDEVARQIMARTSKEMTPAQIEKEVVAWIRSPESGNYLERFGYDKDLKRELKFSDAKHVYDRVDALLKQFAPDVRIHKLIMEDALTVDGLKKLFPDIEKRPAVITDLVKDLLGTSNVVRSMSNWTKDVVTWLATVPTSRLSYNPYFAAKYQQKLQNMVAIANAQGRRLSDMDQNQFEAVARNHALTEYRKKINSFNRDMNYHGLVNYVMAFFPAVVEQYRAYGHIFMDHPEFPYKILAMSNIPNQIGNVQVDEFGTEYVEVELPLLGGDVKGRLPTSWFNPVNPTGGHILSAGPVAAAVVNAVAKRTDLPEWFTQNVLPFGVQANTMGALTPGTLRRAGQAFQAYFTSNGEQYNKDVNMFMELKRKQFEDIKHKKPSGSQLKAIYSDAANDALKLSVIRALGAGILPAQPRYVTPLQVYSDLLSKYQNEYGQDGAERFTNDYPEYYLLVDKLTDSTSGLRSDDTAVNLVRKNGDVVETIVAVLGQENLSVLGSVFNDDDYAFSSAANAYLVDNAIPGTRKKFKEQGDALESNRSSIVNKGWKDWNQMIEVVSMELEKNNLTPGSGYGSVVLDAYKKKFLDSAKESNNLWWQEKQGTGYTNKMNSTITALTIAANTPKLWKELAKQPRWHSIVDYLVYRYKVKAALDARDTSITNKNATDIKYAVGNYVTMLRKQDVNFGKFYDRYFADDDFKFTYDE